MKSAKVKTQFICQACGLQSPKWQGQCSGCGEWNSLEEVQVSASPLAAHFAKPVGGTPIRLGSAAQDGAAGAARWSTGIDELDRVLGGGLVPGAYTLLGGAPGIGKSTLLLQMAEGLSGVQGAEKKQVFYVSAEESTGQTGLRASRLALKNQESIFILNETSLEQIFHYAEKLKPQVLVVDSIQTVQMAGVASAPGTISQIRECSGQLMNFAKSTGTAVFVIGHITKDGALAGPRLLEHIVDTVLTFEGDPHYHFRILRALKNRFGPTNEMGVFQMFSEGLKGVPNPSQFFLEEREEGAIGSVVFTAMEGSRPLLCEVQALVIRSYLAMPRRTAIGVDLARLNMIVAVLDRYLQTRLFQSDVFLNVAGGVKNYRAGGGPGHCQSSFICKNGGGGVSGILLFWGNRPDGAGSGRHFFRRADKGGRKNGL